MSMHRKEVLNKNIWWGVLISMASKKLVRTRLGTPETLQSILIKYF